MEIKAEKWKLKQSREGREPQYIHKASKFLLSTYFAKLIETDLWDVWIFHSISAKKTRQCTKAKKELRSYFLIHIL